ncbi:beta-glucosidase H [Hydrocarboniphaga sp.]|uniref:beta-glucosidase n=1 Tax=Hydrocarboniphaga sp. TaxID=2033016 RepID=UPI003D0D96C2
MRINRSILRCAAAVSLAFPLLVGAQSVAPDQAAIERRVDTALHKLSVEQKIALIGGTDGFYVRGVPEIGLPPLRMSDGPYGVGGSGAATAYAGGIGLAASWNPSLAARFGGAIGRDARARGVHFWLAPGVNIYRAPMNGRNMEYYGEDPYLAAKMVVPVIRGVQEQGVVATVKHFIANNSEYDRRNLDSLVDDRAMREIYLPAFEAAVKEAQVGAVMSSYNLVNGDYLSENRRISRGILKDEWGFDGIFMSDWEAAYDGVKAANAGLDLEMPVGKAMNPETMLKALADGSVTMDTLDDKVRRILRVATRFGFLDREQKDPTIPLFGEDNRAIALDTAREAIVLLKNDGGLLPLQPKKLKSIAVIGPRAWPATATAGGSSKITPLEPVSLLTGIGRYLGEDVRVLYSAGLPTEKDIFKQTTFVTEAGQPGLRMEVFDNPDFAGKAVSSESSWRLESWKHELWTPSTKQRRSIRWTGRYVPAVSGEHLFLTAAASFDTYTLTVDGKKLIDQPRREGQAPLYATQVLEAGKPVTVTLDYRPDVDYPRIGLGVAPVAGLITPEALKMAQAADAAIVTVGFDAISESEAYDRTFNLPWGQEALIKAVAAVNPKTVVTVTSGGAYATESWLPQIPALLQNWYPGQEGGQALAEVLFGARSPSGKLPMSFERRWEDNPTHDWYYAPPHKDGEKPRVRYGEGVFVGYRWYASQPKKPQPLFAFGHGLSYTRFKFDKLDVGKPAADGSVTLAFDVTNTGAREGAEVAQIYVGQKSPKVKRPARELKGFSKLQLAAGATQRVSLTLDRRAFAYFDVKKNDWQVDAGRYTVYVGNASDSTPLTAEIRIGG